MTPIEFSAWIRGVDAALNGAMPSKELWAEVVKEAQFVPAAPIAPLGPIKRSIFEKPIQTPPNPHEYVLGGAMAAQGLEQA